MHGSGKAVHQTFILIALYLKKKCLGSQLAQTNWIVLSLQMINGMQHMPEGILN